MIAIEAIEKMMVELNENGYKSDLLIEPAKKRLTLRCNLKAEDMLSLARKVGVAVSRANQKPDRPGFRAKQF